MKIAMFYAHWEKFNEPWSTPKGTKWELESRGHEISVYNLYHADGDFLPKVKERVYSGDCFNKFSIDYRNGYKPDALVLFDYGPFDYIGCDKQYFPDIPFVLEAGDTPQSFRMHFQKAHKFHAVVTPDYQSVDLFNKNNINAHWMTHWADDRIFYPRLNINSSYDVVTTCGGRGQVTEDLKKEFGDQFENSRYYFGDAHAEQLCKGKIVFQKSQFREVTRRIFEGMACGRMVLTDRLPEETRLHELFTDNEDIVYYDNSQDAIDKIKYFSTHDKERETIALNGFNKVMSKHTVKHRVDQLEEVIRSIKL